MQRTLEGFTLENDLIHRGYSEIEHAVPSEWIEDVVDAYADFTLSYPNPEPSTMDAMLPEGSIAEDVLERLDDLDRSKDTQKQWHKYRTNCFGIGKPEGYTNRSFQTLALASTRQLSLPSSDPKEFYHHTPRHLATVVRNHKDMGWGPVPSEVSKLDTAFSKVHATLRGVVKNVCSVIEETHPDMSSIVTPQGLLGSPLRLVYYHPSDATQLAAPHYDKSVLTLQLAESHQGLRVAVSEGATLQPIVRSHEKGVLFAGHRLSAKPSERDLLGGYYPDSAVRPAWHDVVTDDQLNSGRSVPPKAAEICARWSLIFFANEQAFVMPTKSAMHSR